MALNLLPIRSSRRIRFFCVIEGSAARRRRPEPQAAQKVGLVALGS
jgi:hypothetical protein